MKNPSIGDARAICERIKARAVIVIALGNENFAGASYGQTVRECRQTAVTLDSIIDAIGDGDIPVWQEPK